MRDPATLGSLFPSVLALSLLPLPALCQVLAPEVRITPNAIQEAKTPMLIEVLGPPLQTIYLRVLPATRATTSEADPTRVVLDLGPRTLDDNGRLLAAEHLDFAAQPKLLPDTPYFLRVSLSPRGERLYHDALFALVAEPCKIFASVLAIVGGGRCAPGVRRALGVGAMRGSSIEQIPGGTEVRVWEMATGKWHKVEGSAGATGVAWEGPGALLVTVGGEAGGLYRIDPGGGARRLLLAAPKDGTLSAPLALADGGVACVRSPVRVGADGVAAVVLHYRRAGGELKLARQVALRRGVHQLLGGGGGAVLAYSLWEGSPSLMRVDLKTGAVIELGYDAGLFLGAMRAPGGTLSALAYENAVSDEDGWEIALADATGKGVRDVAVGKGQDLKPAWRPDGAALAYVAQAGKR